jgi:predicted ATPase
LPYGEGVAFWALGEIVKAEAGMLESHDSEAAASKLTASVAAVIDDPDEAGWVERHLGTLVGLEAEETLFGDRRAEAFAAWRRFIERLAERRPTVLVLEDLHWADDALLDFVEYLVAWAADVQLLVLCTARPELLERRPAWRADSSTSRVVPLAPLSDPETHELLDALLGAALLPAKTRSALLSGATGNPLYAQEFVRMLEDRELVVRKGRTLQLREGAEIPFPDSLQALIAARLDTLPQERKTLLQDAAVIGKVFWTGALAAIGERDEQAISGALHELVRAELVRPARQSTIAGEAEYSFWHVLVRDVAYGQIPRVSRAAKHEAAAGWIERQAPERIDDLAEVLAHH